MKTTAFYEFTDAGFEAEVLQSQQPVLVDFWAPWCGPCRVVSPTIEELAEKYADSVKVGKLNVDEHQGAAAGFGITSIPSVVLFKDGERVKTLVGVQPKQSYEEAIESVLR